MLWVLLAKSQFEFEARAALLRRSVVTWFLEAFVIDCHWFCWLKASQRRRYRYALLMPAPWVAIDFAG